MSGQTSRGGVTVSRREAEVFDLVGKHLTHVEIGEQLFISARTVESHVASLRRKLGMIDHRSLVRLAAESRLRPPVSALPQEASSFLGRGAELDEVAAALASSRVVSVVGPGGTGKTRLVMRAASDWSGENSVDPSWIDLAAVVSPTEVLPTLAATLGVAEPGRRTHEQVVIDILGQDRLLLVLDNCEQVLDEVAVVAERILAACANVTVLLTSRTRLVVPHEQVIRLQGLEVGSTDRPGAAVALFMERANAGGAKLADEDLSRVAEICRSLDGMPLAIELAAARVASIGLDGVELGLVDHRGLLVGGARVQTRHRSVSDAVDWSYQLLSRLDQEVLTRLSSFRSSFSKTDACVIAAYANASESDVAGALGRLTEQSLLETMPAATGLRYRMLEMVRQFGLEQMSLKGDRTARERHLSWCKHQIAALHDTEADLGWADEVDEIADEMRATIASTPDAQGVPLLHDLAVDLAYLLFQRGRTTDAQNAFERAGGVAGSECTQAADLALAAAVAKCRVAGPEALKLEAFAASKALAGGDIDLAVRCLCDSAQLIVRFPGMFDDPPSLEEAQRLLQDAMIHSGHTAVAQLTLDATEAILDREREIEKLDEMVEAALGFDDLVQASVLLDDIAARHIQSGDPIAAFAVCRRRLDMFGTAVSGPRLGLELKDALRMGILTAIGAGQLTEAVHLAERHEVLPFLRAEPGLALEEGLAPAALAGNWDSATEAGQEFLAGWEQAGRPVAPGRGIAPAALAMICGLQGNDHERDEWLHRLELIRGEDVANRATGYDEIFTAIVELHNGRNEEAVRSLAGYRFDHFYGALFRQWHAALSAEAAVLAGHSDLNAKLANAIAATEHNPVATALAQRACVLAGDSTWKLMDIAAELDRLGCPYQAARTLLLLSSR